ncbi:carbon starvation protein A [Clostridium acetireducens DSM 10703]|uniref:Carbon starvation protein A n=1 Tax=Clostridium acetireducens DSM 10703 TaxID=1121290 RepID=A0A1E8EXM5_9CLOT|nr:carbon starvation protein A [Clostridium acetireducens]OFI05553.1 carbon starvation protein A [Clostridium acetireducens DSM 10703]
MITFLLSLLALILGYVIYGSFIEKKFGADDSIKTPAIRLQDGVDFIPMSGWRIFMIQFLNIAGLGPIFGAILGAMYGPVAFLWIVFGCIFIGSVHDYFSGMLSVRNDGASISEVVGKYLGNNIRQFMRGFSVVLLILVGVVFVKGPAGLLGTLTGKSVTIWVYLVFAYYIVATLLPIDKLIGKIYPIFGACLLFMAFGIGGYMIIKGAPIPNLTPDNLVNMQPNPVKTPIFPMLFITIACGAISGFHSTQSPLMARCITSESQGKKIFFGSMIAEGIVALVWAAAAMCFFGTINGPAGLNAQMAAHKGNAAWLVNLICNTWLGRAGGALAILGVVACPITSGDTAFRSARLTVADFLHYDQKPMKNRLMVSIPMFVVGFVLTRIDFNIIWRYFGWANQTLGAIILWTAAMYMAKERKNHWLCTIPSVFMTAVCTSYILMAPEGFKLSASIGYPVGILTALVLLGIFMRKIKNIDVSKDNSINA